MYAWQNKSQYQYYNVFHCGQTIFFAEFLTKTDPEVLNYELNRSRMPYFFLKYNWDIREYVFMHEFKREQIAFFFKKNKQTNKKKTVTISVNSRLDITKHLVNRFNVHLWRKDSKAFHIYRISIIVIVSLWLLKYITFVITTKASIFAHFLSLLHFCLICRSCKLHVLTSSIRLFYLIRLKIVIHDRNLWILCHCMCLSNRDLSYFINKKSLKS